MMVTKYRIHHRNGTVFAAKRYSVQGGMMEIEIATEDLPEEWRESRKRRLQEALTHNHPRPIPPEEWEAELHGRTTRIKIPCAAVEAVI